MPQKQRTSKVAHLDALEGDDGLFGRAEVLRRLAPERETDRELGAVDDGDIAFGNLANDENDGQLPNNSLWTRQAPTGF